MDMLKLKEKLDETITEAKTAGLTLDNILEVFEFKVMGLRDEVDDEGD